MKTTLLELMPGSTERLMILVIDGSAQLRELRALCPNAESHAVTPYEEIAAHAETASLGVHFHVLDWRRDLLPFAEGTFDRILSPFAVESAYEPYDALMTLNRCLKETGTLYTGYTNIRYHRVLRELKRGAFPVRGDRHLYAKPEIVRLLNDTLYKEIHFFAGERDDDPAEAAAWSSAGFANVSNETARLLHRIEYSISPAESIDALRALCMREGIFHDYLADFADEICVHRDPVARALKDLFAEI